jgi:hypothetical protein
MSISTRIVGAVVLAVLVASPVSAEIFYDDFSRADGPLGDPWQALSGELRIASEHLAGPADDFGVAAYRTAREFTDGNLQFLFSFAGDQDDGRLQLYLIGESDTDMWGFNAVIGHDGLLIRDAEETVIASSDYAPPSDAVLRARFIYLADIQEISLVIETLAGDVLGSCATGAAVPEPFGLFALAIENTGASSKWFDDVYLITNGRMCNALADGYEASGRGYMDGCDGVFLELRQDQAFVETTLYTVDGPYLRMHAHSVDLAGGFEIVPPGCYLIKLDDPTVGDTWPSYLYGMVTAEITAIETLDTPAGLFDAFRVEYRANATDELVGVIWFADEVGVVRYGPGDFFYWDVVAYDIVGGEGIQPLALGNWWATDILTGAPDQPPLAPRVSCRPNPFNPRTTITGTVPVAGHARLRIFDVRGRLVATLLEERREAGPVEVLWDGRDRGGRDVPGGVYMARLEVAGQVATGRLTLVR